MSVRLMIAMAFQLLRQAADDTRHLSAQGVLDIDVICTSYRAEGNNKHVRRWGRA